MIKKVILRCFFCELFKKNRASQTFFFTLGYCFVFI